MKRRLPVKEMSMKKYLVLYEVGELWPEYQRYDLHRRGIAIVRACDRWEMMQKLNRHALSWEERAQAYEVYPKKIIELKTEYPIIWFIHQETGPFSTLKEVRRGLMKIKASCPREALKKVHERISQRYPDFVVSCKVGT